MLSTLRLLAGDPLLRTVALALLLMGTMIASIAPYQSLLAVKLFGLSESAYAAVLLGASAVSVAGGVAVGILTDQTARRRRIAVVSALLIILGNLLVLTVQRPWAFVAGHGLILPLAGSLFGQLFALARLASERHGPRERDAILAGVRALFALPFILILPVWSLVFARGGSLILIYPVLAGVGLALVLLIRFRWPPDGHSLWQDDPSGLGLLASLGEIATPMVLSRLMIMGAITASNALHMVILGLSFEAAPARSVSEVALYAGIIAGLEVPVMLSMGVFLGRFERKSAIAIGAGIYAVYLVAFPVLTPTPYVWILPPLAAVGGGIILSLPLAYLQDLMGPRAGAGGSLIGLQKVVSDGFCAAIFATGAAVGGYGTAAVLGALVSACGVALMLRLDRA